MADIELEIDNGLIAVDDHDRQQRLMAARDVGTWHVLEGPIDGTQSLSLRTTAETTMRVLIETLEWLAEDD